MPQTAKAIEQERKNLTSKYDELDLLSKACAKYCRQFKAYQENVVNIAVNAERGTDWFPRKQGTQRLREMMTQLHLIEARIRGL